MTVINNFMLEIWGLSLILSCHALDHSIVYMWPICRLAGYRSYISCKYQQNYQRLWIICLTGKASHAHTAGMFYNSGMHSFTTTIQRLSLDDVLRTYTNDNTCTLHISLQKGGAGINRPSLTLPLKLLSLVAHSESDGPFDIHSTSLWACPL